MGIRYKPGRGGPNAPGRWPPSGRRCRCCGQRNAGCERAGRAEAVIHRFRVGRTHGCVGAPETPVRLIHGCRGPERPFPRGDALGHPGGVYFRSRHPTPLHLGAFSVEALVLGTVAPRSGRGRGWRKKSPQDTLSQKVLRIASQHGAKARGGGTPLSLKRFNTWATQQRKETAGSRWTAHQSTSGEPRAHLGWKPSEAASLPTQEKGQASGFPPRPFSCVMTPDCLQ